MDVEEIKIAFSDFVGTVKNVLVEEEDEALCDKSLSLKFSEAFTYDFVFIYCRLLVSVFIYLFCSGFYAIKDNQQSLRGLTYEDFLPISTFSQVISGWRM